MKDTYCDVHVHVHVHVYTTGLIPNGFFILRLWNKYMYNIHVAVVKATSLWG